MSCECTIRANDHHHLFATAQQAHHLAGIRNEHLIERDILVLARVSVESDVVRKVQSALEGTRLNATTSHRTSDTVGAAIDGEVSEADLVAIAGGNCG